MSDATNKEDQNTETKAKEEKVNLNLANLSEFRKQVKKDKDAKKVSEQGKTRKRLEAAKKKAAK